MGKQKPMGTSFDDDFDMEFEDEFALDVDAEVETAPEPAVLLHDDEMREVRRLP